MQLEQVFSDRDSEDEVDDDIADFEDRRVRYDIMTSLSLNFEALNLCMFLHPQLVSFLPSCSIILNFKYAYYMQMLDDFVDVTKDEKLIMHMWNSFVRKQRLVLSTNIHYSDYHNMQV